MHARWPGDEEQLAARAEPAECSRWAMTCLLGCVGAALTCLSRCVVEASHLLGLFVHLLGIGFFGLCLACVVERFDDDNTYPRIAVVDGFLSF
jgi:hypothetical protein